MAKVSLDRQNLLRPPLRLSDDPLLSEIPAQLPKVTFLQRTVTGRDDDGNREMGWGELGELLVVAMENREVVAEDIRRLQVKITALWNDGVVLDATELAFRMDSIAGLDGVFRLVGKYEQNGFRLMLTGVRNL